MGFETDVATDHPQPILVTAKGDPLIAGAMPSFEIDLAKFHSGRWAIQLDAVFARRTTPAVILAQGVACLAVAWWAQLSPRSYLISVRGAVFRSPLHVGLGQAPIAANASNGPNQPLPFPSIMVSEISPNVEQVLALADRWGSHFVDLAAPLPGRQSNRSGSGTQAEQHLRRYLALLDLGFVVEASHTLAADPAGLAISN